MFFKSYAYSRRPNKLLSNMELTKIFAGAMRESQEISGTVTFSFAVPKGNCPANFRFARLFQKPRVYGFAPQLLITVILFAAAALLFAPQPSLAGALNPMDQFMKGEKVSLPPIETLDGAKFDFNKKTKNKVVIMAFWLHNCEQCIENINEVDEYLTKKKLRDKAILVTVTRGSSKVEKKLIKKQSEKWSNKITILIDPEMKLTRAFNAFQAPSFIAVGADGKVKTGAINYPTVKSRDISFLEMISLLVAKKEIPEIQFIPYTKTERFRKMIGKAPKPLTLKGFKGGSYSLEQYKNKKNLVVVFWHPYCAHCKSEMDVLADYYKENSKKYNYELLSISSIFGYAQEDEITNFIKSSGAEYVFLVDEDSKAGDLYTIQKIPTVFFIDKSGKVFDVIEGETKNINHYFTPILEAMGK